MGKVESYRCVYANRRGDFLVIESLCSLLPPAVIHCSRPFQEVRELQYISIIDDIFITIYNKIYETEDAVQLSLSKLLGLSQQHISRIVNGYPFPKDLPSIESLIKLYFKLFP